MEVLELNKRKRRKLNDKLSQLIRLTENDKWHYIKLMEIYPDSIDFYTEKLEKNQKEWSEKRNIIIEELNK